MREYRLRATRRPNWYDLGGAVQFNLLTFLGLREQHYLLDIGCGPLRVGKLLIPYLLPGHYFGTDVAGWIISEAIEHELGTEIIALKKPTFSIESDFQLSKLEQDFDFILAQGVLCYMGAKDMRHLFAEAKVVMREEALFIATYYLGSRSYTGDEFTYPEIQRHSFPFIHALAGEEGLSASRLSWPYLDSKWLLFVNEGRDGEAGNLGCIGWFRKYRNFIKEATQ